MGGPFAIPDRWEDAREGLVALLRPVTVPFDALRGQPVVARPVAAALHAVLVWDGPRVRAFVKDEHLKRWGVSADAAFTEALSTLDPAEGLFLRDDGLWELAAGDGCEAARALLPGWIAAFRGRVPGEPIVGVPHARRIVVAGSGDLAAVTALSALCAREWKSEGDPISPVPYVAAGAGIAPWSADEAPPWLKATVRAATHALAQREYQRLGDSLDAGPPLARYDVGLAAPDDDGVRATFAFVRWEQGPPMRLPEANLVVFSEGGRAVMAVPFGEVQTVVPACLIAERAVLPVWRTGEWPTSAELARLRAVAWPPERWG